MPAIATEMFFIYYNLSYIGIYKNCSNLAQQDAPLKNKIR
jgi:hypothetical protein